MPRDVMPIMTDRDLARAMAEREDAYISGTGTPAWKKQSYGSDLSLMGRETYLSHLSGGNVPGAEGVQSPRPGGDPVEKYLPGAEDFMPEYSEQLIEKYPGWRVPYMGDTRQYPEGHIRGGEDVGGQTTGYGGYYDENGKWIGFGYREPAVPGNLDSRRSRESGNIGGRDLYSGKGTTGDWIGLPGDPKVLNGVKQAYLDYEDLVQAYPEMAGISPEDLALESVRGDQEHYFLPEGLWGLYNSIGRADDPDNERMIRTLQKMKV